MSADIEVTPSMRKSQSDLTAEALGERKHKAPHAGVHMAIGADRLRERRDGGDIVNDPLRILRRRANEQYGLRCYGLVHRRNVRPPVGADLRLAQ